MWWGLPEAKLAEKDRFSSFVSSSSADALSDKAVGLIKVEAFAYIKGVEEAIAGTLEITQLEMIKSSQSLY